MECAYYFDCRTLSPVNDKLVVDLVRHVESAEGFLSHLLLKEAADVACQD